MGKIYRATLSRFCGWHGQLPHQETIRRQLQGLKTIPLKKSDAGWRHRFRQNAVGGRQGMQEFIGDMLTLKGRPNGYSKNKQGPAAWAEKFQQVRLLEIRVMGKNGFDGEVGDETNVLMKDEAVVSNDEIQVRRAYPHVDREALNFNLSNYINCLTQGWVSHLSIASLYMIPTFQGETNLPGSENFSALAQAAQSFIHMLFDSQKLQSGSQLKR